MLHVSGFEPRQAKHFDLKPLTLTTRPYGLYVMGCGEGQHSSSGASWAVGEVSMGLGEHHGLWGRSVWVYGSIMGYGEAVPSVHHQSFTVG